MKSVFLLIFVNLFMVSPSFAQGRSTQVCYGEYSSNCYNQMNVSKDVGYVGCGTNMNTYAENFCSTHGGNDSVKYSFFLVKKKVESGGKCGYALFEITCKIK